MAEPHVVSALREKRAEISGELLRLEEEIVRRRAELLHLDATLSLFAPELEPNSIKPKRRNGRKPSWFCHGQRSRLVLSLLRTADRALTTREIATLLMTGNNLNPSDVPARDAVQKTVLAVLNEGKRRGIIQRIASTFGEPVRWLIAPVITPPCRTAASSRRNHERRSREGAVGLGPERR
jgi:hypothetical protein